MLRLDERHYLGNYFPVRAGGEIVGVAALVIDYTRPPARGDHAGLDLLAPAPAKALVGSLDARAPVWPAWSASSCPDFGDFCGRLPHRRSRRGAELAEAFALDARRRSPSRAGRACQPARFGPSWTSPSACCRSSAPGKPGALRRGHPRRHLAAAIAF